MKRSGWAATVLAVTAALALSACSGGSSSKVPVAVNGSTVLAPYFGSLQASYLSVEPQVLLSVTGTSSGTGIKYVSEDLTNIGIADLPANQPGLVSVPVVVSAIAVVYNLPGLTSIHLNGTVLAQMYAGRITRWNEPAIRRLNPKVKLPDTSVQVLERSDSSGSTFQYSSYLQEQSSTGWPIPGTTIAWPKLANAHFEKGSDQMAASCQQTIGCVAYLGASYINIAESFHLGVAALANGGGKYVLPTRATIAQALAQFARHTPANGQQVMIGAHEGYPIINLEYAVVKTQQQSGGEAAAIRQFLRWVITAGASPSHLSAVDFVALPATPLGEAQRLIATITAQKKK